ncbi:MAG: DUF4264 family protein [Symbiobacteriia bacterium]
MYNHQPIHDHLPLLGEFTFTAAEAPHRLVTFLNKTLKRRGIIFGLTQLAPHEFKFSIYDLMAKENGGADASVPGLSGSGRDDDGGFPDEDDD